MSNRFTSEEFFIVIAAIVSLLFVYTVVIISNHESIVHYNSEEHEIEKQLFKEEVKPIYIYKGNGDDE